MKIAFITNIPSPYRVFFFDELHKIMPNSFTVIYCAEIEPNRNWNIPYPNHPHQFLKSRKITLFSHTYYLSFDVFKKIKSYDPNIVVTAGFQIPMIFSWLYALAYHRKHIVYTDSWLKSIKSLSWIHKFIRKLVISSSKGYLCISEKGKKYLLSYGAKRENIFICPLVINNSTYFQKSFESRKWDLLFSGQIIDRKMPLLFADIANEIKKINTELKVLIIGTGPLEEILIRKLEEYNIDYQFRGFVQQSDLSNCYSSSKLLLFPTKVDPWGVVANEALASGTPVLTCENAGVANELVINNYTGFVLPLNYRIWSEYSLKLLNDASMWNQFSNNCINHVNNKYSINMALFKMKSALININNGEAS